MENFTVDTLFLCTSAGSRQVENGDNSGLMNAFIGAFFCPVLLQCVQKLCNMNISVCSSSVEQGGVVISAGENA